MNILLVDDDKSSRKHIAEFLIQLGHSVVEADDGREALDKLNKNFDLVLSDSRMPEMSGLDLLRELRRHPDGLDIEFVMFTAYGNMDSVIEAMRLGAFDYLLKPLQISELIVTLERLDKKQATPLHPIKTPNHTALYGDKKITLCNGPEMGVFSAVMQELMQLADRMHQDRSVPILIEGETGTGKELLARYIHYGQEHSERPFVGLNCAALTASIFESELFGYEGGAFSGALPRGHQGKLDAAQGGTLFLDEIAETPSSLQAKLLRVLQEKEYYRVGGLKQIKTDVRIICATNQKLEHMVEQGLFRADLFYRLNVGRLYIPPLRERKEEIIPLALMFLHHLAEQKQTKCTYISDSARQILLDYPWPGNVRELRNLMEWITLRYDDAELQPFHLDMLVKKAEIAARFEQASPDYESSAAYLPSDPMPLADISNAIIMKALEKHNGNKTETAKYLGISRSSLYYRLKHM
jgi:two-component system response regulator AtoC